MLRLNFAVAYPRNLIPTAIILLIALSGGGARAGIVTSGEVTGGSEGVTLRIEYTSSNDYKILDERDVYPSAGAIHVPAGAEIELHGTWSAIPEGGYLEKAVLTLTRREGDESTEVTSGNAVNGSFIMGVSPATEYASPSAFTLSVIWQKLEQAATKDSPAVYRQVTSQCSLGLIRPRRTVETKLPGDTDDRAVMYADFDFFLTPYNTPFLDELTAETDVFNVRYGVHVNCPSPEGPDKVTGRAGVMARVIYLDSHLTSPWSMTDKDGGTTVTVGSSGFDLSAQGTYYAPALYVAAAPLMPTGSNSCPAYIGRTLTLPALKDFIGTLDLKVTDMDANPLRANLNAWGGPYLLDTVPASGATDSAGQAQVRLLPWKPSTGTHHLTLHLPPRINLAADITHVVDGAQMLLVDGRPAFLSPHFSLHNDAYTFKNKGTSSKNAVIQYLDKDDKVLAEFLIRPSIQRDSSLAAGRDRHYYEITPTRQLKLYKARVVFEDPDEGGGNEPLVASGTEEFRVQAQWAREKSSVELQFRICAVGEWAGQFNDFFTLFSPGVRALQMAMADEVMPTRVMFTNGPGFTPNLSWHQVDVWGLQEIVAQLDAAQRAGPFHCIIGIVPPNYLDSTVGGKVAGVAFDAYKGAVLIDPSKIGSHGSVHEFLHTLGLPDRYEGDYYGNGAQIPPPSSNGYKPMSHDSVVNIRNQYPRYQAFMYDHAKNAWATTGEFTTLLNFCCDPITYGPTKTAQRDPADASLQAASNVINLSGAFKTDMATFWTAELAPVFGDSGVAQNPYAGRTFGDYYARVVGVSNNTLAAVYFTGGASYNATRVLNETGASAKFHSGSIDKNLRAAFSLTLPIDVASVSRIELGPSNQLGQFTAIWNTIAASAHAPVVSAFSPSPKTLSGAFTLSWKATDADPADAAKLLNHRVLVSDGGATWSLVNTAVQYSWDTTKYSCTLNSADFPKGSHYAFKILSSDGLRTGKLTTAATYIIDGFDPAPSVRLGETQWNGHRPDTGPLVLAVPVINEGNGVLTIQADPASLPAWLIPSLKATSIAPRCAGRLLLTGDLPTTGVYQTTINLKTNDPSKATIAFPIRLEQNPTTTPPRIHQLSIAPFTSDQRPFQPGEMLTVTVWEYASRGGLNALLTIERVSPNPAIVLDCAPLEEGPWPGMYQAAWEIPADAANGEYAIEVTLADPKGGPGDTDGLIPGQDARFPIQRFNNSPVFTLPSSTATSITAQVDKECVLNYKVSDPDGDALDLAINGFPFAYSWDRQLGQIRWYPSTSGIGHQLVLSARDARGAIATRTWKFVVKDSTVQNPDYRALPGKLSNYTTLAGVYNITVTARGQRGCRVDYRLAGAQTWTQGAVLPYTEIEPSPGSYYIYAQWDWSKLGLQTNTQYELRFVNIDKDGHADSAPLTRLAFTSTVAGTLTQLKAPTKVFAGKSFQIRLKARNDATQAWSSGSGIKAAPTGTDPFYSGMPLTLSGWQQVTQGATIAWTLDLKAPTVAGQYTTRWSLLDAQGKSLGQTLEAKVTVVADPGISLPEMRAHILGKWTPGSDWLAKADLNQDGKITVADLVAFNNLLR